MLKFFFYLLAFGIQILDGKLMHLHLLHYIFQGLSSFSKTQVAWVEPKSTTFISVDKSLFADLTSSSERTVWDSHLSDSLKEL